MDFRSPYVLSSFWSDHESDKSKVLLAIKSAKKLSFQYVINELVNLPGKEQVITIFFWLK